MTITTDPPTSNDTSGNQDDDQEQPEALLTAKETARKILDTARTEAEVLLTEARLKAEETTFSFANEAATIVEVKDSLNLTTAGVLTYLANTLLSEVQICKLSM